MDIIDSFINKDGKYEFIPQDGDASKKKFYGIKNNDNLILLQITTLTNLFDEYFDQNGCKYSQYDYFKHSLDFLDKIGNVPKIIAYNDCHGIIIMEKKGDIRLKEYLENNRGSTKYIYQAINWLVKLNKLSYTMDDKIMERSYGVFGMTKEIRIFIESILKYANNYDIFIFTNAINKILIELEMGEFVYNHRDYQFRNMMLFNDQIYIIDTQDICIGPSYCDIATLLFNPNIIFTMEERKTYAKYYHTNARIKEPFDNFFIKILYYGFVRILKSYGRHSIYFVKDNRYLSFEMVQTNRKLLAQLSNCTEIKNTFSIINNEIKNIFSIIDKHNIIPIILCAGKGSRMNNDKLPKPLCEINGRPMLFYILDTIVKINPYKIIIVVGHQKEMVINKLKEYPYKNIVFVVQDEQLGTGHAVMQCEHLLENFSEKILEINDQYDNETICGNSTFQGQLLVLFGDKPLITIETIETLISDYFTKNLDAALVTYLDEISYKRPGRIIRNSKKQIIDVYEESNINYLSNEFAGGIQMYNSSKLFDCIHYTTNTNSRKEYYLADVIKIMHKKNYNIETTIVNNRDELLNVNTVMELEKATKLLKSNM